MRRRKQLHFYLLDLRLSLKSSALTASSLLPFHSANPYNSLFTTISMVNSDKSLRKRTAFQYARTGSPFESSLGKCEGLYIPPFKKTRMMMIQVNEDKNSVEYQWSTWEAMRRSINGLMNKVNATNIKNIIPALLSQDLIRGRGLFCRSLMKSQMASPRFTDVFAALVACVNTKFPEVTELLLKRIIWQLKISYQRKSRPQFVATIRFIAHLVNQQVVNHNISLELVHVLLQKPTGDSAEIAVGFVAACGFSLQELSPKALHGIFKRFREILHQGEVHSKRVQFLIEGLFAIRRTKFQGYPAIRPELDLVEQYYACIHEVTLDKRIDPEFSADIFKHDPNFLEKEKFNEELEKMMLDDDEEEGPDDADTDTDTDTDAHSEVDENELDEEPDEESMQSKDEKETNLVNLRNRRSNPTENLREHLKNMQQQTQVSESESTVTSESESSSESDHEPQRKRRRM